MTKYKVGALQEDETEIALPEEVDLSAWNTSFDDTTTIGQLIGHDNVQEAIEHLYQKARAYTWQIHRRQGTLNNGSFFYADLTTSPCGSYSGYPSCYCLSVPYNSRITSINVIVTDAAWSWTNTTGPISFIMEVRSHYQNGSNAINNILASWGSYTGTQLGYGFHQFTLYPDSELSFSNGNSFNVNDLIGIRFQKSGVGVRDINNFTNIILQINFEEIV